MEARHDIPGVPSDSLGYAILRHRGERGQEDQWSVLHTWPYKTPIVSPGHCGFL